MDDRGSLLPAIEVQTAEQVRFSIIWMHGLGADGADFEPIVPEFGLPRAPGVRFVFPHAPEMPVTCNGGYVMRAWYDIISLDSASRSVDQAGIVRSRQAIRRLIAREGRRGIPPSRVFLAGFSQGGAVAYTTALTHDQPLAGVIALSTYIPAPALLDTEASEANRGVPIFAGHGDEDDVVSLDLGIRARDFLAQRGYRIEWHEYPMPHSICLEEVQDVGRWLKDRLAAG